MKGILIVCILILQIKESFGDNQQDTNFDNFSVYDVIAYNDRDRAMLYGFHLAEENFAFMNLVTNQAAIPMKVLVKNTHLNAFEKSMADTNIDYTWDPEYLKSYRRETFGKTLNPNKNFLTYDQMRNWTHRKIREYPNFLHYREVLIQTHEKRELVIIKVSLKRRPHAVYIVGGDVARDWISSAVVLNFINRLTDRFERVKYDKKRLKNELFDLYDIYVVPVLNPDGYSYSTETNHPFWMANRQMIQRKKACPNGKRDIVGVNLDRNWHLTKHVGVENECNYIYLGQSALSENECIGLFSRLNKNALKMVAFIHVRGFGRLITIPTATTEQSVNHELMMQLLPSVCNNLRVTFNETYHCGTTSTYFYNFTSNMADYVKKKLNIPMVLTVSLQHEDNFLPTHHDISLLTDHFQLILNDTLYIAKDIYGPLINSEIRAYKSNLTFILFSLFLTIYFK